MGILTMLGLMRVEDHNRIVAKQDALIDRAAEQMKGEDFDRGTNHADRVGLVMARLRASRTRFDKAVKDLAAQSDEIAQRRKEKDSLERDYKLRGELLTSARAEIAALRHDAEWARARKAKAAEYEANRRVRKAKVAG